jgi:predicted PolB exonuclease-like 3'-5' exonuclease
MYSFMFDIFTLDHYTRVEHRWKHKNRRYRSKRAAQVMQELHVLISFPGTEEARVVG